MPDAIIQIKGRKWPSIVLETGYLERLYGLSHGTDVLLDSLGGRIGIVILVKIEPLGLGNKTPQNAYVEMYMWTRKSRRRIILDAGR